MVYTSLRSAKISFDGPVGQTEQSPNSSTCVTVEIAIVAPVANPAGHDLHAACLETPLYVPGLQRAALLLPSSQYVPMPHSSFVVEATHLNPAGQSGALVYFV